MSITRWGVLLVVGWTQAQAQYTQQGNKLVGTGAIGPAEEGYAVAISADGNTAIVGGLQDSGDTGAAWIFARTNGVWNQQGAKLVGSSALGLTVQGMSVAISGDGNTAVLGGDLDNNGVGAAWVFGRSGGVWSQQAKLVGSGAVGGSLQGAAVAISTDGNTVLVGGFADNNLAGAAWVFTRAGGNWSQQGSKLVAASTNAGWSVALSADGNTAAVGGFNDTSGTAAAWIFTRANGVWTQQGGRLVGSDANTLPVPTLSAEMSVAISGDGNTLVMGGDIDTLGAGATWVFTRANGVWAQQGSKLVGSGAAGSAFQGGAVAISADASTIVSGGWTDGSVGAAWVFAAPAPAGAVSTGPAAGSGMSQSFAFTFSDKGGAQGLTVVDVLINSVLDGRHACYVAFVPSGAGSGSVFLVDDGGDAGGPYSGMLLPGNGMVQNSQCSITAAGSSASASGNTLTLNLAITFSAAFSGNHVMYLAAQDATSNSDWQALGTWGVPGAAVTGPGVVGVSPGRGSGAAQMYTFTFSDTNGWQDISVANVLIGSAINGIGACYLAFLPASGAVLLVDDAGDAGGPFSGLLLPVLNTISNSQCSVSGVGSSVSESGGTLALTLSLSFSPGLGNRVIYLSARSSSLNSGWQAVGTISVP